MSVTRHELEEINERLRHALRRLTAQNAVLHRQNRRLARSLQAASASLQSMSARMQRLSARYQKLGDYVRTLREYLANSAPQQQQHRPEKHGKQNGT